MEFIPAVKQGLKKFFTFRGRASRSEFWWFYLFLCLVNTALYFVLLVPAMASQVQFDPETAQFAADPDGGGVGLLVLYLLALLVMFIPFMSAAVRRLHDGGRSGWWFLLSFIPVVGPIVLLIWWCTRGTSGPNAWGPDPLEPDAGAA
ncbi:DUF805 domain-containing protein [Phaeovibrio sulfidiphilus]|uniref:DUF805 domain-containing protein n=1 Tax=Phaeovibrio sulfidiphilus TaxID=1220600 RepID=A0A8J7CBL6_9PROT|nr:DUF805 domain-containing protein [Phaeovibrio sulfidiphilus]MBE1236303.1 DUF805 domain-containing protein [Phaeovibrio sulfidiphilus]